MNKFYAQLHIVIRKFRKPFLCISLLLFLILYTTSHAGAQCNNGNASGVVTAPSPGNTIQINTCAMAGDYSTINTVTASTSYTVTSTTGTDFFTVRQNTPGGPVIAFGVTPLTWTSLTAGTYYVHINTNASCGTQATCRTTTIKNNACIPPSAPLVVPTAVNMCLTDPPVKLQVVSSTPATSPFCAANINLPVPDNNQNGVSSTVNVSGIPISCTVTGISVTINMPHTRAGDMVFVLKSPNGQVINLDYHLSATGGGGNTSGLINTIISSAGVNALSSGVNPYTGTFKADLQTTASGGYGPPGPTFMAPTTVNWASLFTTPNGTWALGMYDGVTGNTGTLSYWCLNLTYTCPPPPVQVMPAIWSPAVGLYLDATATVPYVAGTQMDVVWAKPVPAGVYTYSVTVQSVNTSISFTNPATITIPTGGVATPYPFDLVVSGLPSSGISVRSVVLNGITHGSSQDIDVILQSPTGQNVMLMSDVGGTTTLTATTYTFDDSGPAMSATGVNASGSYKPTNNGSPDNFPAPGPGSVIQTAPALSMFTGSFNGLWRLFVIDDDGTASQGMIGSGFTINFDTGPGCTSPPQTVTVTVGQTATITTQPVNQNICIGNNAVFSVVVAGSGPFTYQWQQSSDGGLTYTNIVNAGVYSGVNTNSLTITAPPITMSGYRYKVVINGGGTGCGGNTSQPAILTVNPLPNIVITANPIILAPGQETIIRSTVTPNPAATYTWYLDGVIVPGANADTIVVDINGLGAYQLSVADVNGCSNISNIITIAHAFTTNLFVYPNPSTGLFQVRSYSAANNILPRSLIVYNNRGEVVINKNYTQASPYQKIEIDLRPYGKGIYWIETIDQNGKRLNRNRVVIQ